MSRAFVKEGDGDDADLPERPISGHPNLVTARGLALMDRELEALRAALAQAHKNADRQQIGRLSRDLRYWVQRRSTIVLVEADLKEKAVGFGSRIIIERQDGKVLAFRIVGEDESDPKAGYVSYVAPVARMLMGAHVGEVRAVPGGEVEVLEIDNRPDEA